MLAMNKAKSMFAMYLNHPGSYPSNQADIIFGYSIYQALPFPISLDAFRCRTCIKAKQWRSNCYGTTPDKIF